MAARLKVYAASLDGLHEWIVAAPNQAEALAAWGVNQNLFQQGEARITDDPVALKAATAAPGRVLRRPAGSKEAFKPVPAAGDLDAWNAAAKATGCGKPAARRKAPDPKVIRKAEAALERFDAEAEAERAGIAEKRGKLDRQAARLERDLSDRREALVDALEAARKAAGH